MRTHHPPKWSNMEQTLVEKYRPRTFEDFIGLKKVTARLQRFAAHPKWLVVAIFIVGDADVNQTRHDDQQRKHTRHQRQIPTPSNSKYSFSSYFLHLLSGVGCQGTGDSKN